VSIFVRDDDVLIHSSSWDDAFGRFRQIHDWCLLSDRFLHVPYILFHHVIKDDTPGILVFPEAIAYIREQTQDGRMRPEIHGWEHVDYGARSEDEVREHLKLCKAKMHELFDVEATSWATPWGANQPHLYEAAAKEGLKLIDCNPNTINKMQGQHGVVQRLKDGTDISFLEGEEIFLHWYEGGSRLLRIIQVGIHGSWDAAKEANRELFR